jgi:LytS/YehU family sensor histidine kinase
VSILLVGSFAFYTWRRRRNYVFQKQLGEAKQEALNAQMSDHFIGNTIDSINSFIETNEKDKASHHLILFSRLIRRVLDNSFRKQITLREELSVLEDYLQLESLRFDTGLLRYEVVIDDDIDTGSALIPPMVIQVLAENALKHGFDKHIGGRLLVRIVKKGESITCSVEDNGRGIAPVAPHDQPGLKLRKSYGSHLAERLIKTFGDSARTSFSIYNLSSTGTNMSGTRAEFTIPYRLAF